MTTSIKNNRRFSSSSGFTFLELMVVVSIIAILSVVAILSFKPNAAAYKGDDTAIQFTRFMREATSLAAAQRKRMRVEIDSTKRTITLYNEEGTVSPTDDVLVKQELLPTSTDLALTQPTGVTVPPRRLTIQPRPMTSLPGFGRVISRVMERSRIHRTFHLAQHFSFPRRAQPARHPTMGRSGH